MFPKKEKLVFSLVKSRGHRGRQGCRCILKQSRGLPLDDGLLWVVIFSILEEDQTIGILISTVEVSYVLILTQTDWATFWGNFHNVSGANPTTFEFTAIVTAL
jgi:hypothetical protein